ncbi:MAG TPA: DUF2142 domain-containing protein [Gammaproteobacteria bacterium]|nr:DUF2142 domain-containing protein [Gammaproteobacteria bacterium]HIL97085.1 DUF2142 domain-containing protein [Pseudomonadales bacterium]
MQEPNAERIESQQVSNNMIEGLMGLVVIRLEKRKLASILLLAVVFIILIPGFLVNLSNNFVDIQLDLTMSHTDVGQLFYASNSQYTEKASQTFNLEAGRHRYIVRLRGASPSDIQKLRIDPGIASQGRFILHDLTIRMPRQNYVALENLQKSIVRLGNVRSVQDMPLEYEIFGTDPQLEILIGLIESQKRWVISPFIAGTFFWLIMTTIILTSCIWLPLLKTNSLEVGFIAVLFGVCLSLSVLIPPFQSPDEFSHVHRAKYISDGNLNLKQRENAVGIVLDPALLDYGSYFNRLPRQFGQKMTRVDYEKAMQVSWSGRADFVGHVATAPYMMPIYLPQAVAFAIGTDLNLTVDETYQLARFAIVLTSLSVIVLACLISTFSPIILVILAMPMMLFQFTSVTIDGFSVAMALLALSCYVRLEGELGQSSSALYWLLLACILVVVTSRPYMIPMLLLPALLASKSKSGWMWSSLILCSTLCVVWIMFGTTQTVDERVVIGESRIGILIFYLAHPFDALTLLYRTFDRFGVYYFEGFIGILGWLDARFSRAFYSFSSIVLAVFTFLSVEWRWLQSKIVARCVLLLVAFSSSALIFVALLINWSEHPAQLIQGVQGRYFTIPVFVFLFAVSSMIGKENSKFDAGLKVLAYLWITVSTMNTVQLLLTRYWLT